MLRRNSPVVKSVESVLRREGSIWRERFVKEVGHEAGVKKRMSYGWWEWWVDKVRRCGRSMKRQDRDRGAEMRLTERTRKLIPETGYRKERSVIRNEDDVGGRARVTRDEEWKRVSAARRLNRDEVMQIWRLGGCEDCIRCIRLFYFEPVNWRERKIGVIW